MMKRVNLLTLFLLWVAVSFTDGKPITTGEPHWLAPASHSLRKEPADSKIYLSQVLDQAAEDVSGIDAHLIAMERILIQQLQESSPFLDERYAEGFYGRVARIVRAQLSPDPGLNEPTLWDHLGAISEMIHRVSEEKRTGASQEALRLVRDRILNSMAEIRSVAENLKPSLQKGYPFNEETVSSGEFKRIRRDLYEILLSVRKSRSFVRAVERSQFHEGSAGYRVEQLVQDLVSLFGGQLRQTDVEYSFSFKGNAATAVLEPQEHLLAGIAADLLHGLRGVQDRGRPVPIEIKTRSGAVQIEVAPIGAAAALVKRYPLSKTYQRIQRALRKSIPSERTAIFQRAMTPQQAHTIRHDLRIAKVIEVAKEERLNIESHIRRALKLLLGEEEGERVLMEALAKMDRVSEVVKQEQKNDLIPDPDFDHIRAITVDTFKNWRNSYPSNDLTQLYMRILFYSNAVLQLREIQKYEVKLAKSGAQSFARVHQFLEESDFFLKEIGKTLDQIDRQVPQKQLESDRLEQLLAETALIRNDNVKSEATVQEWQMDRIFVNEETIWDGAGQDKVDLDDVLIWALKIAVDDRVLKSAPGVRADLREFDWAIEAAPNLLRYAFYLIFSRGMDNTDKALQYRLQRESQMSIGFQFDEQDMGMLKMVVGTNYYQFQQKALVPQPDATGKEMPAILADDKNGHPLALARQILLLLGGELAIENASDGTATVTVTLPYSQLKVNGIETSEPVIALAPEQMDPRKPDILIADDDLVILRTSREQLSSRFNVWVATDGEQAHQAIQQHGPFALIVTDVQMPIRKGTITDGVVLVQTLRREEYRGPISLRTSLNSSDPYLAPLVTGGQISRILPKGIAFEQTLLESVLAILEAFESDQVNQAI